MDWDSPTTKKHIQEAEAQQCKLLGPGKNKEYRLYAMSCGSQQQVTVQGMRKNSFRCSACQDKEYRQEAAKHGCKMLGEGSKAPYRLYLLSCGHKREMTPWNVQNTEVGELGCGICIERKHAQEAKAQKCELLGAGKDSRHRLYLLPCGHRQEGQLSAMRNAAPDCKTCVTEKLSREAEEQGCTLLGAGKNKNYRFYALKCGHKQDVGTLKMRSGKFRCTVCQIEKLDREADAYGCKLIGEGRNSHHRLYAFSCGHKREVQVTHIRSGSFNCQICEETSRSQPSNLYLLHIKVESDEWLKLGYAKSVSARIRQYGLPKNGEVKIIESLPFPTGNEAHTTESEIHVRYKRKRLKQKHMKIFHTVSGYNECYPVTILETLLGELEALKPS